MKNSGFVHEILVDVSSDEGEFHLGRGGPRISSKVLGREKKKREKGFLKSLFFPPPHLLPPSSPSYLRGSESSEGGVQSTIRR